jgi:hypothetical protein
MAAEGESLNNVAFGIDLHFYDNDTFHSKRMSLGRIDRGHKAKDFHVPILYNVFLLIRSSGPDRTRYQDRYQKCFGQPFDIPQCALLKMYFSQSSAAGQFPRRMFFWVGSTLQPRAAC